MDSAGTDSERLYIKPPALKTVEWRFWSSEVDDEEEEVDEDEEDLTRDDED